MIKVLKTRNSARKEVPMSPHHRKALVLIAVLCILTSASIYTTLNAQNGAVLKIGILFPLTGDAAAWGAKGRKGVELATDELNASNSCGRRIATVFEDSAAQPTTGVSAFQKFASIDKVPAVIGDLVSSVTLAVAPIAERNKIVLLSPTASAPAITAAGEYVYRIWPSDLAEGRAAAEYAVSKGYRRAATLYLNNDYGLGITTAFSETFSGGDRRIVFSESYLDSNQDFRAAITKLQATKPDVLYIAGYYTDSAAIVRQARVLNLQVPVIAATAVEDQKFIDLSGGAAEGVVYPLATGFDVNSTEPTVKRFVEAFRRRFNESPGFIEAQAYDATAVICTASKMTPSDPSGSQLKAALDNLGVFNGVGGKIAFDKNGDVVKPIRLRTVRDGKFTDLDGR
jgi:branched-chain amino acid transport system substrate-binding protein